MELTRFDRQTFLQDYWQQKPLLIRNPWRDWANPLDPSELAGLACEDAVESRLIIGGAEGTTVENGPIPENRFDSLGTKNWTLLVQAVDHHIPEVAALLNPFRFIPNWRIDDVMVSFAADGGGVGPHFDHYDVFLIQGLGRRRWQVGGMYDETSELLANGDLRLLADFSPTEEWLLEPGDMLYVPPGIAHNGVAVGEHCMTYSIGFRAPSRGDLIGGWMDDLTAEMGEDDRYADPGLKPQDNPGEISSVAIDRLYAMITERLTDRTAFARWFGEYNSTAKYTEVDWQPEVQVTAAEISGKLSDGAALLRNPASRFAYLEEGQGTLSLFVQGETFQCEEIVADFARQLCADARIIPAAVMIEFGAVRELIAQLINLGSLAIET